MIQKEKTVQEITEAFENTWRLAYPNESKSDTNYKLHNYLRVLNPQLASTVGMMNPSSFQAAKDMAYQIEAYMPKNPIARLHTLAVGQEGVQETDVLAQIVNATQQANQAVISQAVTALTTATQAVEQNQKQHEQEQYKRNREFEDMKRTLGRARPAPPRTSPYPSSRDYTAPFQYVPPPPRTGGNTQPLSDKPKRDYSQMICHACGQKGHSQYYRGCNMHPEHNPNMRMGLKNEGGRS